MDGMSHFWLRCIFAHIHIFLYPIGSMYAIYGNIYHQYTPVMLAYIPAPWILRSYGYDYVYVHDKTWIPHGVCFSCCIVYSWAGPQGRCSTRGAWGSTGGWTRWIVASGHDLPWPWKQNLTGGWWRMERCYLAIYGNIKSLISTVVPFGNLLLKILKPWRPWPRNLVVIWIRNLNADLEPQ